jgi:hypothetical protein
MTSYADRLEAIYPRMSSEQRSQLKKLLKTDVSKAHAFIEAIEAASSPAPSIPSEQRPAAFHALEQEGNRKLAKIFGMTEEEIAGTPSTSTHGIDPVDIVSISADGTMLLRDGRRVRSERGRR